MGKEQDKKMHMTKCRNCNHQINITMTGTVQKLITQLKSQREDIAECIEKCMKIRLQKNGMIQAMHKAFAKVLDDVCDKDREMVMKHLKEVTKVNK